MDYESQAIGLDGNEVRALLVAADFGAATEHALISLLALNGLRVSEALGADIEALDTWGNARHRADYALVKRGSRLAREERICDAIPAPQNGLGLQWRRLNTF